MKKKKYSSSLKDLKISEMEEQESEKEIRDQLNDPDWDDEDGY